VIRENNKLKLTQPVLIQSFVDEFEIEEETSAETPSAPGTVLTPVQNKIDAVRTDLILLISYTTGHLQLLRSIMGGSIALLSLIILFLKIMTIIYYFIFLVPQDIPLHSLTFLFCMIPYPSCSILYFQ